MKSEKMVSKPKITTRKAVTQAMNKNVKEVKKSVYKDSPEVQESIRLKAYELYVQRGYIDGNDTDDWLTAERLVVESAR